MGIDFGIFNNRLTGSLEYYHKKTNDLIGMGQVNLFTGYSNTTSNVGNLVNNGVNINLNSVNITTANFSWQSGFVFGFNSNKLVDYQQPQSYEVYPFYKLGGSPVIGYPLNSVFAYKYAGLDNTGSPQVLLANGKVTKDPNEPTSSDLVYKGTSSPRFTGGLANTFRYKQFQLSVNMVYNLGGVMRKDVNQFYAGMLTTGSNLQGNINVDFLNRWQKPGDETKTNIPGYLPVENYTRNLQFYTDADVNVVSSSYLKLSEAALTYNLDPAMLRWLKIQSASLRVQVNNFLLWKANKDGINPEFQDPINGVRGLPVNQHTITLGANINF